MGACGGGEKPPVGDASAPIEGGTPLLAPRIELGRHAANVVETRQILVDPIYNDDLDVVRYVDSESNTNPLVYFAWRSAPSAGSGAGASIDVMSSGDESIWTRAELPLERDAGIDYRAPRFLSWDHRLFLFVGRLEARPGGSVPVGMYVAELSSTGTWSPLRPIYEPGFVPSRARVEGSRPYLVTYSGAEHLRPPDGEPLAVHVLTSTDGGDWGPLPGQPAEIARGGVSEADFTFLPQADGGAKTVAVMRNEGGDDAGWGSKVCHAPGASLVDWTCANDPRKFDSPQMFSYDGEVYLLARRNVTESGNFDLDRRDLGAGQTAHYQAEYAATRKRCSLWRYVQASDRFGFILDLPSRGNTCVPGKLEATAGRIVIYDVSSSLKGPDEPLGVAEKGATEIYRHVLELTRR